MLKTRGYIIVLTVAALAVASAARAAEDDKNAAAERQARLIALLQSDAPPAEKAITCKQLAIFGNQEAVPALAPLLANPELASWARIALEAIPGAAADEALREASGKVQGKLLVGVINSIAVRRDSKAVAGLVARLKDADTEVAAAAAEALGRIGGDEAAKGLKDAVAAGPEPVRSPAALGLVFCAEKCLAEGKADVAVGLYDFVRAADLPKPRLLEATRGAIVARGPAGVPLLVEQLRSDDEDLFAIGLSTAREMGGAEVAQALVAELARTAPEPAPQETPKVLAIVKAQYGAGDQQADVTDKLAAAVSNNALAIEVSNGLAGDPAPGKVKELRVTYTLGGEEKTVVSPENQMLQIGEAVAEGNPRQARLIYALGDVGQRAALPAVLKIAQDGSWSARVAAVRVLGQIGNASAVPVLLDAARSTGTLGQAALQSLADLEGGEVDAAIAAGLAKAEGSTRAILIQLVGERQIQSAVATLLKDATSENEPVRLAAIGALGMTVGFDQVGALIERFLQAPGAEETGVAKTALMAACTRMPDRDATAQKLLAAMAGATAEQKASLLELVGAVGGAKALDGMADAARSGDDALADAASRVLGEWMSADAAPVLLDLARSGSEKYKIRALRGYLRIARQLDVPDAQRIAMCREAAKISKRDAEKKLILEVLRRNPAPESLALAASYLADSPLKAEAASVVLTIAEKILPANKAAVAEAMKQVLDAGAGAEATNRAKALLQQAAPSSRP